jgi:crossover junction endodeoxyribonuclease RuvC
MGIDPSLSETGIIGLRNGRIELSHLIKTKPSGDNPTLELDRLVSIIEEIKYYAGKYKPDAIVIEGIAFMARNTRALIQLCGLNYLLRYTLFPLYKTYIVTPTSLKKFITNKGNCQKDLVLLEIYKRYKVSFDNNNLADAFSLAKIGESLIKKDKNKLTIRQSEVISILEKQYEIIN